MTTRLLVCEFTLVANTADQDVTALVDQTKLEAAIPVGKFLTPWAFYFDPEDADITIKKIVASDNGTGENVTAIMPEMATGLSLGAVNAQLKAEAGGYDSLSPFTVAHGFKLLLKGGNAHATEDKTIQVVMKVENQPYGQKFGGKSGGGGDEKSKPGLPPYAWGRDSRPPAQGDPTFREGKGDPFAGGRP